MSDRYHSVCSVSALFFFPFSGEVMVQWAIKHRMFAYGRYVKESVIAVQREFRTTSKLIKIRLFSPIIQSYISGIHLVHEVH